MKKTALVILHDGVEEIEAITPIDILRRGGLEVTTASLGKKFSVEGRNGVIIQADTQLSTVENQVFDAVVLPGGPGIPQNVRPDGRVKNLLKHHYESGKLVAVICAAPLIAHDAGILEGKPYTAHFSVADELIRLDPDKAVIREGNVITSRGAGTSTVFSLTILAALADQGTADAVADSICLMQPQ